MSNEHTQIFRLLRAVRSPYSGQQRMVSDHLSGMPGEIYQEVELFWRQVNLYFFYLNLARRNIDTEISDLDHCSLGFGRNRTPPKGCSHPGQQFVHVERLGDVIVSSSIERLHFDGLLAFYRENDDRNAGFSANCAA